MVHWPMQLCQLDRREAISIGLAMATAATVSRLCRGARIISPQRSVFLRCASTEESSRAAHAASVQTADQDGTSQSSVLGHDRASSLNVHTKRPVPPLSFQEETLIFSSDVDVQEAALQARRKCKMGAALSTAGLSTFLASLSLSGTLPLQLLMVGATGLVLNSYLKLTIAQKLITKLAARHVERLWVLPTAAGEAPKVDGAEKLLLESASIEERLDATKELPLRIRTTTCEHSLVLVDPFAENEAKYKLDDALPDLSAKASMAEMCKLGLLDIDADAGKCHNAALVAALKATRKVLVDEEMEPRHVNSSFANMKPGMLSEVTRAEVERAMRVTPEASAAAEIEAVGWRASRSGAALMAVGLIFTVGEQARDPDGVARWKNIKLPI
ncbi:unnamed protein product [Effrenium voratum]|nr:unnamed protein product [Effrenium voratum]CAJ1456910.1 unnamed protein product [Effrenium voratum]